MAVVAASLMGWVTRRRSLMVLALLVVATIAAGCNLGGEGGSAELAVSVDQADPDKPVLVPAPDPVESGGQYLIRLEVPTPLDAAFVRLRMEKRVGTAYQQRSEYDFPVTPPWNVAVIPISVGEPGDWNVALIVNTRKITDVTFTAKRP